MIPGKEALVVLELMVKRQVQIFPDACDLGIPITTHTVTEVSQIRRALEELRNIYKTSEKISHWGSRARGGWDCKLFIPFEQDGAALVGVQLSVSFQANNRKSYVSLNFSRQSRNLAGVRF